LSLTENFAARYDRAAVRQPIPFGKYLLLERISVGGMAEVFKAKSFGVEGFEKIIAIKRILPSIAEDGEFIQMFIDEAKIAGQLSHANICQIFELGKIQDSHFIAMEFVWGKDLLQIQNRFRKLRAQMPMPMAAFIAAKVCEGLDYAHRRKDALGRPLNIIHRDVSPQNILVGFNGCVKLIDFGVAKAAGKVSHTITGAIKGKYAYMSPEQARGDELDLRSDIFGLGVILYELLAQARLFKRDSESATLKAVLGAKVAPPSSIVKGIPKALDAVVLKALARDRDDRYQSAGELQMALESFIVDQRLPATPAHLSQFMKELYAQEAADEESTLIDESSGPRPRPARPLASKDD
jgi:serine/threonine protein kinase